MKLEAVVLRQISLELREPFAASWGREHRRQLIIVEAGSGGLRGYGEVPVLSAPFYQPETVTTAWHILQDFLIPLALGETWSSPGELAGILRRVRGHSMARAGLEGAVWDLYARRQERSLAELIGGQRARVAAGITLNLSDDTKELVEQARLARQQGYRRIKVKIAPGRAQEPLEALRQALGKEAELAADANGAYTPGDTTALQALDSLQLSMLEQPFSPHALTEHAALQERLRTPVCLDESIESAGTAETAMALGACRMINVKWARVGGLTEASRIHDGAVARKVPVWCGGMLASGIGRAHSLALASLPGFRLPADLGPSARYWQRDLVDPPFTMAADGTLAVPSAAGIGVAVDRAFLAHCTVRRASHFAPRRGDTARP